MSRKIELRAKHYIYEFFIVVLGISVPFLLNNWSEARKVQKLEKQYYENILREMKEDLSEIEGNRQYNARDLSMFRYGSDIILNNDRSSKDTLGSIAINLSRFSDFKKKSSFYEALAKSGELHVFSDKSLITRLQKLEELYVFINRLEESHGTIIINNYQQIMDKVRIKPFQVMDVRGLYDFRFQNLIEVFIFIMEEKDMVYGQAVEDLNNIIDLLSEKLKES